MHTCKPVSCSSNHFQNTAQVLWLYPRLVLGKYKYKKATECRWCQFSSCYGKSMKQHSLGNQAFNLFSSLATRIYWYVCFTCAPGFKAHCAAIKAKGIIFKIIQKMKTVAHLIRFFSPNLEVCCLLYGFMIFNAVFMYQCF